MGLAIAALAPACGGASTATDAPEPAPASASPDPFCHDGTLAGAPTPAFGFCSDGSHRAPTVAPLDPILAWRATVPLTGGFLVDGHGVMFGSDATVYPDGTNRASLVHLGSVSFLDRDGNVVWREIGGEAAIVTVRTPSGDLVRTMSPAPGHWSLGWAIAGAASDRGEVDLIHTSRGALSSSIGWVERIDEHGSSWVTPTGCSPINSDVSQPATTLRTANGGVASACGASPYPSVLVNVFDREGAPASTFSLRAIAVGSNLAQLPSGELAVITVDATSMVLWTLRGSDVLSRTRIPGSGPAHLAVARDGTLVVRTATELLAFTPTAPEATLRFRVRVPPIEVYAPMGAVSAAPVFVDADATIVTWGTAVEARSLVDGSLRWAFPAAPKDHFTYVTAAGPHALYALTASSTLTLLRDR